MGSRHIARGVALLNGMVALAGLGLSSPVSAALVNLTPTLTSTTVGGTVTLDLNISGLGNGTALGAFDTSVNFDSAKVSFQSATFGDPVLGDQLDLGHLGLNGPTATPGTGTVNLIETDIFDSPSTLLGSQAHSFTLAVLSLTTLAGGTTPVSLTLNSLADQNGNPFSADTQGASITIGTSPVPLPDAGLPLLAIGLSLLSPFVRLKRGPRR
jgi:hypothetical protein